MTKEREALKLALEALGKTDSASFCDAWKREGKAIIAIKEALAQPEQEPVAHIGMIDEDHFADVCRKAGGNSNTPLYTSPPKREWVGLTFDEKYDLAHPEPDPYEVVKNVEIKLKGKNT